MNINILELLLSLLTPQILLSMSFGVLFGITFGCIPGLTITTAVVLMLPLTYAFDPLMAISTLIAVYIGGMSGGLISAILLRMPGTSSSVATTFDGYPMAKNGQAGKALGIGISASFFGGIFSSFVLLFIAPQLTKIAIQFGPYEYFGIAVLALSLVSILVKGNVVKGLFCSLLGMMLSFVGPSPIDGKFRFTFSNVALNAGFHLLVVIIGMFALSELIFSSKYVAKKNKVESPDTRTREMIPRFGEFIREWKNLIRSSFIGTFMGILPGLGGGPGSMVSYAMAKKASKNPETFGQGNKDGIYATEAANNAVTGGALIPLLTLGIPGDVVTAVLLGGFLIHGVEVGPLLFMSQPDITYTIILGVFVANIIMFLVMTFGIKHIIKVLRISKHILFPFVAVCCVIGVLGLNSRVFDVAAMIFFGIFGMILEKNEYPLPPLMLAYILGPMIEENYRRTLLYHDSITNALSTLSLGTVFLCLTFLIPVLFFLSSVMKKRKA